MDTVRILMMFGLIAIGVCLASAEVAVTDKPGTHVDRSNGVETLIPGTTEPKAVALLPQTTQPQPVPNYLYNQRSNSVLQNGAGSIIRGPDGRTVLLGAGGSTIVTNGDSSSEEDDDDDDKSGSNVIINGKWINSQYSSGNGGVSFVNSGGEGSTQFFNNYQLTIINGGLQLKAGDKVYNFPAKDGNAKSQEKVEIDGNEATVEYDNGNIVLELADGTVFAKTEDGLFSGNRQSYVNRAAIKEAAVQEAAQLQKHFEEVQNRLQAQMRDLEANIQRTLGNIGLY